MLSAAVIITYFGYSYVDFKSTNVLSNFLFLYSEIGAYMAFNYTASILWHIKLKEKICVSIFFDSVLHIFFLLCCGFFLVGGVDSILRGSRHGC